MKSGSFSSYRAALSGTGADLGGERDDDGPRLRPFRVWLHTTPSPGSTYYDGYVDVFAEDACDAGRRAIRKLTTGTFSDYPPTAFRVDNVEALA